MLSGLQENFILKTPNEINVFHAIVLVYLKRYFNTVFFSVLNIFFVCNTDSTKDLFNYS